MTADVTIFMPVYKAEAFVGDAITSVLAQTYTNFKLDIAVEPTDDNSLDVCKSFASDPRVNITENPSRLGWVGNVNACFDRLETPYFAFCFHDDALAPGFIESLRAILAEQPSAIAAFGAMQKFGAMEGVSPIKSVSGTPGQRVVARINDSFTGYGLKGLQRSELVLNGLRMPNVGKTGFAADLPFEMAYALRGDFVAVDEVVYHKRFWSDSVTAGWQTLVAQTRSEEIMALQAEMLRTVGDAQLELEEIRQLVQLILDRFPLKYSVENDADDLLTLNDDRETLAPVLLIADLLSRERASGVQMRPGSELIDQGTTARFALAWRLNEAGQPDMALHYLRQSLRVDPDNLKSLLFASRLLLRSGGPNHLEEAQRYAQRATELSPNAPRPWMHLANANARLERWSEVIANAEAALKAGTENIERANALLSRARKNLEN